MSQDIFVSVLIPAKNEANNLKPLLEEVREAMANEAYEIIVVDDGSTDATLHELRPDQEQRLERLAHPASCSARWGKAPRSTTRHGKRVGNGWPPSTATARTIRRTSPACWRWCAVSRAGAMCSWWPGHRTNRRDSASKRWASRFANGLRRRLLKDATPDTGCGLKLIERAAFLRLPYFDHMHRFIPALIQRHNGRTINYPVNHRARTAGVSKYGNLDRALVGILDLVGVWWLIKRTRLNAHAQELEG